MAVITCKQCGAKLRDCAKFCSKCGTKVEEARYCDQCGAEVQHGDLYCDHCGVKLSEPETIAESGSKSPDPAALRSKWIPNKEYITFNRVINIAALENPERFKKLQKERTEYYQYQLSTELKETPFWKDCFIVLEDGTMVGFVQGHTRKYVESGAENYRYNLYRLDTDGTAVFLNAGIQGSMEYLFVLNGVAYCTWGAVHLKAKIY